MSWLRAFKLGGGLALVNYIIFQYVLFVAEVGRHDFFIALLSLGLLLLGLLMILSGWKNQTMKEFLGHLFNKR